MSIPAASLQSLLEQINGGRAASTLAELDELLVREPTHAGLLTLRAEALRLTGRLGDAVEAFQHAGKSGGGARNWLAAGILLAGERDTDEAVQCLQRALAEAPDDEDVLDALITTLFNSNRHAEGVAFARKQLAVSSKPTLLSRAALLLQGNDLYEESSDAFKRILALSPDDPAIVGSALVPARFTCEWEWIESLQQRISRWYEQENFSAPQEYPLTHITWCADEAYNLRVTRAYVERTLAKVEPLVARSARAPKERIRVGYLSCDFRNHATMHLMAGLLELHDRRRFEVYAYDYSVRDISDYRQRFLNAIEHHVPIHTLSERQAAERIAADELDLLLDLKLYTGGGRDILAYRPAPLQAAYLGFPGSAASPHVDYIVSDRFVTPASSAPYYTEKFCRLPHSYQCNDRWRVAAPEPGTRATHGLPEDKVVFGAFNQSYKVDRGSFSVWLRILKEVPQSVLWLLGQSSSAVSNLTRHAQLQGVDPSRLIFAPFALPQQHLARLPLADAVLDTLVCNGHTTTSDALWAGVPVVTARGRHFASRVSESLLNAMELPELVGADPDEMVRIAKRIGADRQYRTALRAKVAANRLTTPLFDTLRFTRNFERAIEMMVDRHRSGAPLDHLDVPDCGPVPAPADAPCPPGLISPLQVAYPACPLCDGSSETLGFAHCITHGLWHEPLPPDLEWMRCSSCGHVHTRHYWNDAGREQLLRVARSEPAPPSSEILATRRACWTPLVDKVVRLLGGYPAVLGRQARPVWVDVGCGDGTLAMTAADYGFAAVGLESRGELVERIQPLGLTAIHQDFMRLKFEIVVDVLTMVDVLQQMPHPREALSKAAQVLRPGGVLVLSAPDFSSCGWRMMEAVKANPYWVEIEQHHLFSRERLLALLRDAGFEVADFAIPGEYKAQMELYAVRKASG